MDGVPTNYSVGSGPVFDWNLTVNTGVISASNDNQYAGNVYTYDAFGRLASMKGANGAGSGFSYGYDQYGNRWNQTVIQGSGPSPSYTFSTGTIPNTNHIVGGVTYDNAGNMTYDGFYYYKYDGNNKVIAVGTTSGGSNVASYAYNSRGMRVSTTTTGPVEWMFDLSGNALTASVPGTTQFYQAEYFVGGRDWGTLSTGGVNFRYPDWVGNGRVWQNVAGTVTQQAAYDAFGDGLFAPGGGSCCNLGSGMFDSAWRDTVSNTYHTLNREYSPTEGRWLTPDPAGLAAVDPSNPQSWNRYAYVMNNPVTFRDPTGLECVWDDGSYDSENDADTGNTGSCTKAGGTWVDHSYFQQNGLADWSGTPNSEIGNYAQNFTATVTTTPANNEPSTLGCFVKGLKNGATGAVVVAGVTALAATVLAPEVVTGGLLVAGAYGLVQTGVSVYNNWQSSNQAGLAYNVGSVTGGLLGGGSTSFGVRYSITGETNLPTSIGDFFGKGKGIDFSRPGQSPFAAIRAAFSKGPDLGGGAGALGLAGAGTASGCD